MTLPSRKRDAKEWDIGVMKAVVKRDEKRR
jgi:hypothetical protein